MPTIEVWFGDLQADAELLHYYRTLLNADELLRLHQYKAITLQQRFVTVRGLLRIILANYLNVKPAALQFSVGHYGKPALVDHAVYFNLSHSVDKLVLAIADFDNIGVDVEEIKQRKQLPELARRIMSETEYAFWQQLPESEQITVFYKFWTKKEAFVKAVGRGIAVGLNQCQIELTTGLQFFSIPREYGDAVDWRVIELDLARGFCAALVVPNLDVEVKINAL